MPRLRSRSLRPVRAGDPGALVIGEESVATDPSLRTLIDRRSDTLEP
jgi:hypothetical protein